MFYLWVPLMTLFFPPLYSSVYFQIRGEKSWNWWLWSGIQEGDLWRKEPGGGAVDRRRKKRRKGRVWVTPLCGSFCCPFLSPTKAWQHKLKVTVDISTSTLQLTNLPLMFQLFIVFVYPGNIIKFFFFTVFFLLSRLFIHLFEMSVSAVLILSQSHVFDFQQRAQICESLDLDAQAKERAGAQWTQSVRVLHH